MDGISDVDDACFLNAVLDEVRDYIRTSPLLNTRRVHDSLTALQLTVDVMEGQAAQDMRPSATILRHPAYDLAAFSDSEQARRSS